MENVELIIGKLCGKYRLGRVIKPPLAVTGGLLHKMYRVATDKGEYAVKILNPNIMKRDNVLNNMIHSEQISNELKNKINLIGAKEFDSKRVIMLDEYYFMVFEWLEYNLKRALGIEGAGENDKEEGKTQLIQTIFELNKCSERQEELRELLYSCGQNCPEELILNIEKLHTTALGITRIKKNLSLAEDDVVNWCKSKILSNNADITRKGKNWYINVDNCIITVNGYSYTIITAHREKKQAASGQKGE